MRNQVLTMGQWQTRVNDAFSVIRLSHMTHADALGVIDRRIYGELNSRTSTRARYSAFIKGYVYGLIDAAQAEIWRDHVEYCYLVDGALYTTSKKDTSKPKTDVFYARKKGHVLNDAPSAHYWIGTDKRYSGEDAK